MRVHTLDPFVDAVYRITLLFSDFSRLAFGRRTLLLVTFPLMAVFLLLTGFGFFISPDSKVGVGGPELRQKKWLLTHFSRLLGPHRYCRARYLPPLHCVLSRRGTCS